MLDDVVGSVCIGWDRGKCNESGAGLYIVNGEHEGSAQCVGNNENEEVEQCEVGIGYKFASATVTDAQSHSEPGCYCAAVICSRS